MQKIIGRQKEVKKLEELWLGKKSDFVAVYGRRRVGKTYLIRNALAGKITFYVTGVAAAPMSHQLANFYAALARGTGEEAAFSRAADWLTAFRQLSQWLEMCNPDQKKVIFLDELPWLDTRNSGFLSALEHFWNHWASARQDIMLVVCGSAAAWMLNHLIRNKGGLHNRITECMRIEPFTLKECEQYFQDKNSILDRYQLLQLYMVLGGIPYYLDRVNPAMSAQQNINQLCFGAGVFFREEYANLYASLFSKAERHTAVVEALAKKGMGLTREDIIKATGLADAGSTTRILKELEESNFIRTYRPFGNGQKKVLYQLVDFYSLFYLKFIVRVSPDEDEYWLQMGDNPAYRAWSGYAFEMVCLQHAVAIKQALGISGVQTQIAAWRLADAQIDLIIDRRDHVINLCEMKFSMHDFSINAAYAQQLRQKAERFATATKTRKALVLTLITTYGLAANSHAALVQKTLTMDALFG
ncbi:MAG: ATP-binding protein [Chitinophagaceae bacterium]|nr:ATP-binding protein [Chitinophagaceae bacterium]